MGAVEQLRALELLCDDGSSWMDGGASSFDEVSSWLPDPRPYAARCAYRGQARERYITDVFFFPPFYSIFNSFDLTMKTCSRAFPLLHQPNPLPL
ncbi:hypothetical protein K438DRAFT_1840701 [Mycena galopus ATCC 62051]|nr:hypothetical protein K438DRAFT_1840701 [Mycena galopus ATCC 62051]